MTPPRAGSDALPPVFTGARRGRLVLLAGTGLAQALVSVLTAMLTPTLLQGGGRLGVMGLSAVLLAAAASVGGIRVLERVLAEDLGQHYVGEVRRLIIASALTADRTANLGVTVARATNDLSALRNWVALGIAPLIVGIPLILGVVVALLVLTPVLAMVVLSTLLVFATTMLALAGPAFRRARAVRRVRGRMASHIADTVTAGPSIRVSGGVRRELNHVDRFSSQVAKAAHSRAIVIGAMRGSAASVTAVLSVLVAVSGAWLGISGADITAGVVVAGMLAAPITDLGRVNEYRQNQRAAVVVLGPVVASARSFESLERRRRRAEDSRRLHVDPPGLSRGAVFVADLADRAGTVPELIAAPGSRVLLTGEALERVDRVLALLTGDRPHDGAWVQVAGQKLADVPAGDRRELVGVAGRGAGLGRGTIARTARYRVPRTEQPVEELLDRVGLAEVVAALPDGERTKLRRGGEPLTVDQQGRLALARALAGDPPLLVLDHVDEQLTPDSRDMLARVLADYPGCVIVRSGDPERILAVYDIWNVDDLDLEQVIAIPAREVELRGSRATTHVSGSGEPTHGPAPRRSAAGSRSVRVPEDDDVEDEE